MNLTFSDLKKWARKSFDDAPCTRVALLGDSATQFLATGIKGCAASRGIAMELFEADYNQVERQLLDPSSELYQFAPQYVVIFQSTHKFAERHALLAPEQRAALADERLDFLASVCQSQQLAAAKIIYFNYPEDEDTVYGSYQNKVSSSLIFQLRYLNYKLMTLSQQYPNLFICDLASLQARVGRDFAYTPNVYVSSDMLLSLKFVPLVAARVVDIIGATLGRFKKCVILDLDNTLWGGVIGDDGIEGIQLGHGMGIGKAFSEFQMWIKKLRQRGIIVCVSSKNDEATAREPFVSHPDMILRLDDIAVFQANWETKVDNIRTIQQILNIGFDSMVFIDDNPFERHIVKEHIPEITVPDLPEDPADYLEYLYTLNLFETASDSSADKDRTRQYQIEAQRVTFKKSFANEDDFLQSLQMVSRVEGFTPFNTPRVSQLSQRSNQFNLRTVRYTESDITSLATDPEVIDLSFTLVDKFGDNGLIAVVVMRPLDTDTLFVDTWLMSCRVLKRGMERFTLNVMVDVARGKGYKRIVGEYIPTAKNKMVSDHYSSLGFKAIEGCDSKQYELDIQHYQPLKNFITRQ